MNNEFKEFAFPDGKCTYHYINPCHNGTLKIPGDTEEGNEFFFEGIVDDYPKEFRVEFYEDEKKEKQMFFSYKVNTEESTVTFSSSHGERLKEKCSYFKPGYCFLMRIKTESRSYTVSINKHSPVSYEVNDSDAITKPRYVVITGDVEIRSFHFHKNGPQTKDIYMTVPYNVQLGDIFTFRGKTPVNGMRFLYEFKDQISTDKEDRMWVWDDIWLTFDARFNWYNAKCIVRNSYFEKKMGIEETNNDNPLKEEQDYKLDILVEQEQFRCFINEAEFCTFKHRRPFKGISKVRVIHNVPLKTYSGTTSIIMTRLNYRTPFGIGYKSARSIAESDSNCAVYFPAVPVTMTLPHRLRVGSCICISGVFKRANRFECILKTDEDEKVYEMVADFEDRVIEGLIDSDDSTRRHTQLGKFPFKESGHFDMQILCDDNGEMCISVDDVLLHRYQPHLDYKLVHSIYISGDVRIKTIALLKADYAFGSTETS